MLKSVEERKTSIYEAGTNGLQLTHAGLGKELAESWGIPARLIEAISNHHTPKSSDLDPELANLVHIGDACARNLGFGFGGDPYTAVIQVFSMEHLAITSENLLSWEEEMAQVMDKDMAFLAAIS